jgi:hypothetical protein
MSEQDNIDRVWDIVEKVGVCMLTTQFAGELRAPTSDRIAAGRSHLAVLLVGCLVLADIVAKRFCASERATLIQDQAPMRNVDFKNPFVPIRLLRIFARRLLLADFCNKIGTSETSVRARTESGYWCTAD